MIGLLQVDSPISNGNLTWTVGNSGFNNIMKGDPDLPTTSVGEDGRITYITVDTRNVERAFFLGTPPSLDLSTPNLPYTGCAFLFISDDGAFPVVGDVIYPDLYDSSSCNAAWASRCSYDLEKKATDLSQKYRNESTTESYCNAIAADLESERPSSCFTVLGFSVEGVALTGPTAPKPLTAAEKADGNCWPTLPKTNDLTPIFRYNHTSFVNETSPFQGYTPVMTLWYTSESESELRDDPLLDYPFGNFGNPSVNVDLKCLKVVDSGNGFAQGAAVCASSVDKIALGLTLAVTSLLAWVGLY